MTKKELVSYVAEKANLSKKDAETAVNSVFDGITEALKAADSICWTQQMNNIVARAEAIVREALIYNE